jgi:lysophospholipase L1-like esterase
VQSADASNNVSMSGDVSVTTGALPLTMPRGQTLYVSDGDSLTQGAYVTAPYSKIVADQFPGRVSFTNIAVSGSFLSSVQSRASAADAILSPNFGYTSAILSVFIGTNDILTAGYYPSNPNTFISDLSSYCDARRTAGYKVVVGTLLPRGDGVNGANGASGTSTFNIWRNSVNTGIRALVPAHCDAVADFAAEPIMGLDATTLNLSYYLDGLHMTDAGQNLLAEVLKPVLLSLTVAPATVNSYLAWNPADKASALVLSNSDYTAGGVAGFPSGRGVAGRDTGKRYIEFKFSGSSQVMVGFVNKNVSLATYPTGSAAPYNNTPSRSLALWFNGSSPVVFTTFTPVNAFTSTAVTATSTVGMAVDFDAGKLWISLDGVYQSSGDPAAGTNPSYTFPANSLLYPVISSNSVSAGVTLPTGPSDLLYTIPSGFSAF